MRNLVDIGLSTQYLLITALLLAISWSVLSTRTAERQTAYLLTCEVINFDNLAYCMRRQR